ncbi:MAG: hypothetical protein COV52_00465 [Gammaproteobacteria bacterium CG11_big_fil_rev_8_21_14_0_20_46_22]|nr:MAG: hypothetical protein COW05_09050 [Gammaproteobacteria bacterium CG12_big_fil_rev_8_21_14_0_65_46_12]PIR12129.1 MAG: hypothetical protein COV52_00465 [Gammaproteobacteria bacterium CG11_big_fil_rev_8_21_14_0_20_46_22]
MRLGIDASNLRAGGGLVHLKQILSHLNPKEFGIKSIIVWCSSSTANHLPSRDWLVIKRPRLLDGSLVFRNIWQRFVFPCVCARFCDFLFIPGGVCYVKKLPFVTMSRNVMPFLPEEIKRYKIVREKIRLFFLRRALIRSFGNAAGLIFLTPFAKRLIYPLIKTPAKITVIPHGVVNIFDFSVKKQLLLEEYCHDRPVKCLYISTLDVYKNQDTVIDAVAQLGKLGCSIELDLVGNARFSSIYRAIMTKIKGLSNGFLTIRCHNRLSHEELAGFYSSADIFIFASSAENMPNILIEAMSSGLPIACANATGLPEILQDAGFYFDPRSSDDLSSVLKCMLNSPEARYEKAVKAKLLACQYDWSRCAISTAEFICRLYLDFQEASA